MNDDLQVRIGGDASGAVRAMDTVQNRAREFAQDVVRETATMAAGFFSIEKAVEAVRASIGKADEMRDLANSLTVFTGSAKNATEAMKFFEEAQKHSRDTADELAKAYRDVLPQAISRGFSQESMRHITQWLSQLGTISGRTLDEMEHGFQMLLAGRVTPGRNPLLSVLGITKKDIDGLGWDQIVTKMQEVTAHFPEMGQSFESTMHKMKDSILENIGGGINEVSDHYSLADGLLKKVQAESETFRSIGRFIGEAIKGDIIAALATTDLDKTLESLKNQWNPANWFQLTGGGFYGWLKQQTNPADTGVGTRGVTGSWVGVSGQKSELTPEQKAVIKQIEEEVKRMGAVAADAAKKAAEELQKQLDTLHEIVKATQQEAAAASLQAQIDGATNPLLKMALETKQKILEVERQRQAVIESIYQLDKLTPQQRADAEFGAVTSFGANKYAGFDLSSQEQLIENAGDDFAKAVGSGLGKYNDWSLEAGKTFAQIAAEQLNLKIHDQLVGQFANDFEGLFVAGGKHFSRALDADFRQLMGTGAKVFAEALFGKTTYDPVTGKATGVDYAHSLFGAAGSQRAQAALGFGSIALNAYQSGQQAPSNAVAMGAISGGISGAGIGSAIPVVGTAVGAVVGVIVGAIAAEMGAMATRDKYEYGIPGIGNGGQAYFRDPKNLTPDKQQQMLASVQDAYDTNRNALTRLSMKLGIDSPQFGTINGMFQPNPSAHFEEHFQQWLQNTLPRGMIGSVRDPMQAGFGKIGLSGDQFSSMWTKMQGLDPAKMESMLSGLADALIKINDASKFMGKGFGANLFDVQQKGNQTFAQSLDEGDAKILEFGSHLKDLVGEDQIRAAGELGDMMTQRMEAEKQFLQQVASALKAGKEAADSLADALGLRLMHKADGSPDYEKQAQFFRSDAQRQLSLMQGATNATDAQKYLDRYLADLDKISQAGFGIGTSTGDAWTKWAQDQINTGQQAFDDILHKLGDDVTSRDAAFLAAIQPSIDAFKNSLGGSNVVIGDFSGSLGDATSTVTEFTGALAAVIPILKTMAGGGESGFSARTSATRAR